MTDASYVVCFFFCPLPISCFFSRCFFSWTGGTQRAVWLKLSPRRLAHALAGGLAQAFAARSGSCFRRRSGSSFRRAVWLKLSPRGLAHALAGGLAQAFAARSCSSFRRAPCFRRRSCSSSRRMLSAFVFRRWPQALAVVPQVALLFLFCSVSS
jgi:hypothetical protein